MKLPEHYKNLDMSQKRTVVANLISQFGNENTQVKTNDFNDEQIDFLFTYFFTESKEKRERMRYDMKEKYKATVKDLKEIAKKLQKLNLEFSELLAKKEDAEEFKKSFK